MKICKRLHTEIVYLDLNKCPLCKLIDHNDQVHDFIRSQGNELVDKLVEYQRNLKNGF